MVMLKDIGNFFTKVPYTSFVEKLRTVQKAIKERGRKRGEELEWF